MAATLAPKGSLDFCTSQAFNPGMEPQQVRRTEDDTGWWLWCFSSCWGSFSSCWWCSYNVCTVAAFLLPNYFGKFVMNFPLQCLGSLDVQYSFINNAHHTHTHTCRDSSHYLLRVVLVFAPPAAQKRLLEKNGTTEAGSDPDSSGALLKCRSWLWKLQV